MVKIESMESLGLYANSVSAASGCIGDFAIQRSNTLVIVNTATRLRKTTTLRRFGDKGCGVDPREPKPRGLLIFAGFRVSFFKVASCPRRCRERWGAEISNVGPRASSSSKVGSGVR